eukprot:NODE_572_length_5896_cov_0.685872.p7 type:complete len:126 gc:universal NODE_572_length_5896_cov_0.685872:5386-5763(+)
MDRIEMVQLRAEIEKKKRRKVTQKKLASKPDKLALKDVSKESNQEIARSKGKFFDAKRENRVLGAGHINLSHDQEERQVEMNELDAFRLQTLKMQNDKELRLHKRDLEKQKRLNKIKQIQKNLSG